MSIISPQPAHGDSDSKMSSAQAAETATAQPKEPASAAAPRKRRKRTAASGAADDCFTCAGRGAQCDRRRPYCTQCLELGKDCSGYKTTLTWGVGVASRGKLRGLSLPVSGGQAMPPQKPRKQSISSTEVKSPSQTSPSSHRTSQRTKPAAQSSPEATRRNRSTISEPQIPVQQIPWPAQAAQPTHPSDISDLHSYSFPVGPSSHVEASSAPFQSSSAQFPVSSGPQQPPNSVSSYAHASHQRTPSAPSIGLGIQTSVPTFHHGQAHYHCTNVSTAETISPSMPIDVQDWHPAVTGKRPATDEDEEEVELVYSTPGAWSDQSPVVPYHQNPWAVFQGPFPNALPDMLLEQSVGRTPRIRYLISYFAEVIAPVIVAFDSPSNPYRTRILQLAQQSDTLQHAIAALSASNLRQRREAKILSTERTDSARLSSMAHRALTDASFQARYGIRDPQGTNREELYHKSMAIRSLNAQLADPTRRHQDHVLATLLLLCLFHICETGVAQFQTQFAGVRKLLAMRSRNHGIESEEAKWCTRMFTWFDAMTATINNREGQLQGVYLDMAALSDEEWAMENLAGCDGRLFKIIARLGRLNILSQNEPVDPSYQIDMPAAIPVVPPALSHYPSATSIDVAFPSISSAPHANPSGSAEFWQEWHSVRQQLESWRLDTTSFTGGYEPLTSSSPPNSIASLSSSAGSAPTFASPVSPTSQYLVAPKNFADLSNISESFRYSALLYTERLAYPDIPSSHPRIQSLVLTSLHYITAVHSDVYLLWPLFITGAECVYDEHRAAIRKRCKDIQKDSGFFNNISCLELLEKIWALNPTVGSEALSYGGLPGNRVSNLRESNRWDGLSDMAYVRHSHGFKWHSIIESEHLDGEYIVV